MKKITQEIPDIRKTLSDKVCKVLSYEPPVRERMENEKMDKCIKLIKKAILQKGEKQ